MNTIRRNPPKPAPSSVRGTLKLRTREAGEPDEADRTSAPVADAPERSKADVQRARPTEAPRAGRGEAPASGRGERPREERSD
ncbi:MAG: pseudouridine synthase, partial [Thauera sp.]